jgi:hypothetical protein
MWQGRHTDGHVAAVSPVGHALPGISIKAVAPPICGLACARFWNDFTAGDIA